MAKGIDRFVSENRRDVRRIDATFVEVSSRRRKNLDFGLSTIRVAVQTEVRTRSVNDSLISGHPSPSNGSGRGVSGDQRGDWNRQVNEEQEQGLVRDGRNIVRDVLAGDSSASVDKTAVGTGTSNVQPTDSALETETGRKDAWSREGSQSNDAVATSQYLFHQTSPSISEAGVFSQDPLLYNREVFSSVSAGQDKEVRIDVTFKVRGSAVGNSVITNEGEDAIAETFRNETVIGIDEFVFGDGTATPSENDTSMGNELFANVVGTELTPEVITAHTVLFEDEPAGQPHSIKEVGLRDNSDRLLWRTRLDAAEKNDTTEFEVYAAFRAK